MSEKKVTYIGELPPPYGGVTVKNKLIYEQLHYLLARNMDDGRKPVISMIDLMRCKESPYFLFVNIGKILCTFGGTGTIFYGFGSMLRLSAIIGIQSMFPGSLKRTVIIGMGGLFSEKVIKSTVLRKQLKKARAILIETEGMKRILERDGFTNAVLFPNPKTEEGACEPQMRNQTEPLKLVYFSQISKTKGALDTMEAVRRLNKRGNLSFIIDFYGRIMDDVKEEFEIFVKEYDNVAYKGIYDSAEGHVYQELNRYDLLVFPTHWKAEGVPGILIEAKMAGIAVIASNTAYNAEVVQEDLMEGIIIRDDFPENLFCHIARICEDIQLLRSLKEGSSRSRTRYSLEKYEEVLLNYM